MIDAVQAGDFDEASAQILDSKAARDPLTQKRYRDLAERMQNGTVTPTEEPNPKPYQVDTPSRQA